MTELSIAEGSVLGIDVGWSNTRESSAVCRLFWNEETIGWEVRRFCANADDRREAICNVARKAKLLAVAIDGPLKPSFDRIKHYRSAERILSRGDLLRIGKPGQSSSPNGQRLNEQANLSAKVVKDRCQIEDARHMECIDAKARGDGELPDTSLRVTVGPLLCAARRVRKR
ncbi:MAG: hypothetical protein OXL38_09380 [Gammaproteobacteria bacterium]|nr:hypothetical protein [Gammaproteobacteria bacterium]